MSDVVLRLAILLGIFFACVAAIEESMYLAIAVAKMPLLAIVPIAVVMGFLVFVGKISQTRKHHHYE